MAIPPRLAGCLGAALAAAVAVMLLPAGHASAEAQASLQAELRLVDPGSGRVIRPDAGQPVRLQVRLRDPVTGQPPRNLDLRGWVRPVADDNSSCTRAAQAFRATRRIPFGSVDLNGILLLTVNRDASVGVIDPKLDLRSSNMIAAHKFDADPAAMAADPARMRALFSFPADNRIAVMSLLDGAVSDFAMAEAPTDLAVFDTGTVWAATTAGVARLSAGGATEELQPLGPGAVHLRRHPDPESGVLGAFTDAGAILMADGRSGATLMRADLGVPLADASFVGRQSVLALPRDGDVALLRYVDDPGTPHQIRIGAGFTRLATGPDGRVAIAYAPGSSILALVDLALGRLVQSVALTDATVSEVAFTDNAAFLISHDGGFLGAIDLATVALGRGAVMRRINLGARSEVPPEPAQLLVPLFPSPQIMAVEPANQTGWIVEEIASTVEMPPMHSTRLRGGVPRAVSVVDRSFAETAPGVFETVAAFAAGPQELVLTTGIAGLTSCIRFAVRGQIERQGRVAVNVQVAPDGGALVAGRPGRVAISIRDDKGAPIRLARVELLVPSLRSSWRSHVIAVAGDDGVLRADLTLPHAGPFVVQPVGLPPSMVPRAAPVIEAAPPEEE